MPQPPQWSNEREPTLAANGTLPESLAAPGCSDPWPAGHTGKERKKERGGRTRTGKKTRQNKAGGQAWHRHTPWISAGERASRPTQRQQRRRTTPRAAALGRPTKVRCTSKPTEQCRRLASYCKVATQTPNCADTTTLGLATGAPPARAVTSILCAGAHAVTDTLVQAGESARSP